MITPPRVEGTVRVGPLARRVGFAEFGPVDGRPLVWLHGTPGARRQIPESARVAAEELGVRIVGIDRPGVGWSTPHRYGSLLDFVADLARVCDHLGFERFGIIGLSGGGPYVLASCYSLPDRVRVGGVLGGVAPARGDDALPGGLVGWLAPLGPLATISWVPLSLGLTAGVWALRPVGSLAFDLYARISPEGDRRVFAHPEIKAMFLDDLFGGAAGASPPLSSTSSSSPGRGASPFATSLCPCAGGTATPTPSCRWPTASTWCRSSPTPSSTCDRARAISAGSMRPWRCSRRCLLSGTSATRATRRAAYKHFADNRLIRPGRTAGRPRRRRYPFCW